MQLVDNVRHLENSHHEGDKQGSSLHTEAMDLLAPGKLDSMKANSMPKDLVKDGVLPHLDLDEKMTNSGKELKNASCGAGEFKKLNDFAGARGEAPGGSGSGSGGGGGHHDSGSKNEAHRFVAKELPVLEIPEASRHH
ncbi:MAG: hypothetical protein KGS72_14125 [Cyanobacteria bacterium REEB67]|nr:hypothetical protein [Cyanobacteria bacterium REEB67]